MLAYGLLAEFVGLTQMETSEGKLISYILYIDGMYNWINDSCHFIEHLLCVRHCMKYFSGIL